jgi:hypothetical protein
MRNRCIISKIPVLSVAPVSYLKNYVYGRTLDTKIFSERMEVVCFALFVRKINLSPLNTSTNTILYIKQNQNEISK